MTKVLTEADVEDFLRKSQPSSPPNPVLESEPLEDLDSRIADLLKRADEAIRRARGLALDCQQRRAEMRSTQECGEPPRPCGKVAKRHGFTGGRKMNDSYQGMALGMP